MASFGGERPQDTLSLAAMLHKQAELEQERVKKLAYYAEHKWGCDLAEPKTGRKCTCGLTELLKEI